MPQNQARRRSCLPGHVESALLLLGRGTCFARRGAPAKWREQGHLGGQMTPDPWGSDPILTDIF